ARTAQWRGCRRSVSGRAARRPISAAPTRAPPRCPSAPPRCHNEVTPGHAPANRIESTSWVSRRRGAARRHAHGVFGRLLSRRLHGFGTTGDGKHARGFGTALVGVAQL